MQRLQKVLAQAGVASRRASEELIAAGRVAVNGQIVTQPGIKVCPTDIITLDGKPIARPAPPIYVLLHKPAGYVTTVTDPYGRPTVMDLLTADRFVDTRRQRNKEAKANDKGQSVANLRLFPVGRLDAASEGLLLLTNDGDLAYRLTHPRFALEKEYLVLVRGTPSPDSRQRLQEGILLDGKLTARAQVTVASLEADPRQRGMGPRPSAGNTWLRFVIHEGRKRQIRRMCLAVGHPVLRLIRVRLGPLVLGDLPAGRWRYLTPKEVASLKELTGS